MAKKEAPKLSDDYGSFGDFLRVYMRHLRRYVITGMLVWVPFIITLWISWYLIVTFGFGIESSIQKLIVYLNAVGNRVPPLSFLTHIQYYRGLGLLTSFLLFLVTGFLTRYLVMRQLINAGEGIVQRIPVARTLYKATQQIRDVFTAREGGVVQQVVVVEYPGPDMYALGFVLSTNTNGPVAQVLGKELIPVFMIFTPPTAGFLLHFPRHKVTPINISTEDAMKLMMSGGAFDPTAQVEEPKGN